MNRSKEVYGHLSYLERRMVQTGDWKEGEVLTGERLLGLLEEVIAVVDLGKARQEVEPFVSNADALAVLVERVFYKHFTARHLRLMWLHELLPPIVAGKRVP